MKKFVFGNFVYEYHLVRQDRKTLSLTVTPDLQIILKCPLHIEEERIEKFLKKKWFWLEKQLSFFKKYQRKVYAKEYISGESYLYLGRQYKLLVKKDKQNAVCLKKGRLIVYTSKAVSDTRQNRKLIKNWFASRVERIFQSRFIEMLSRFNYKNAPALTVREMKRRWGSFFNKNKIFLNPKLIQASKECIDYVIVHELCHMKYKNHDARFYKLLKSKISNWEEIKERLELRFVS